MLSSLPKKINLQGDKSQPASFHESNYQREMTNIIRIKVLANEDTLLPTQMFPHLPAGATFVADTKNVSDFVQKHFVSTTNVS